VKVSFILSFILFYGGEIYMGKIISIDFLRDKILGNEVEYLVSFDSGNIVMPSCDATDYGFGPMEKLLADPDFCEILEVRDALPIWENILPKGIEKKRPIYRVTEKDGSFLEIVLMENENEDNGSGDSGDTEGGEPEE